MLLTWQAGDVACAAIAADLARRYLGPDYSDLDKRGVVGTITGECFGTSPN